MKPLLPGQAAVAKFHGKPCVILCDWRENLPFEVVSSFEARSCPHEVTFGSLTIALVEFAIRQEAHGVQRYYRGWINELDEHVLEDLATMSEVTIVLADAKGKPVSECRMANWLREVAHKTLGVISDLADKPWTTAQFAAAVAYLEASQQQQART